jgi:hypothetical protein
MLAVEAAAGLSIIGMTNSTPGTAATSFTTSS